MQNDYAIGQIDRDHFEGVVVFLRVAERLSFRAAAEELGLSPSAVGQIVRALERRVGAPLLVRTTRRVGLTEAGEQFLRGARLAVQAMGDATHSARTLADVPSGLLRLSVPRAVAYLIVDAVVTEFCRRHPALDVELYADDGVADLVADGFDAGIRFGELVAQDMVAVRLTPPFPFTVVASPDYLEAHGTPRHPEDLSSHRCIRFRQASSHGLYRWEFARDGRNFAVNVDGDLIVNDSRLNVLAAESGAGLAYSAQPLVAGQIADGRLVPVLAPYLPRTEGMFLCYPSRAQSLPKLRAFAEFARNHFQV